tara:strand:+ start:297 stop:842 length:546 start_codon:yes stop_codon:yes gene_type:complete
MRKIISLFERDYEGNRKVFNSVVNGAEWVVNGEGIATVKFDGTCCLVKNGKLFKRYEVKKDKTPPNDFIPADNVDKNTGKQQGWRPVGDGNEDKYHREAFIGNEVDGTYELCGEKIQGNPEKITGHKLIPHGKEILNDVPRDFEGIKEYLKDKNIEGIVWHHSDGRMVKIKKRDFDYTHKQ